MEDKTYIYGYTVIQENRTPYNYDKVFLKKEKRKEHLNKEGYVVERYGELVKVDYKIKDERVSLWEIEVE